MCPFSILAFLQPTTVDKEPLKLGTEMSDRDSKILVELREVFDTQ